MADRMATKPMWIAVATAAHPALNASEWVLLVAQRNPRATAPEVGDLYSVGTLAWVVRSGTELSGPRRLLVQGVGVAQVEAFIETSTGLPFTQWATAKAAAGSPDVWTWGVPEPPPAEQPVNKEEAVSRADDIQKNRIVFKIPKICCRQKFLPQKFLWCCRLNFGQKWPFWGPEKGPKGPKMGQ